MKFIEKILNGKNEMLYDEIAKKRRHLDFLEKELRGKRDMISALKEEIYILCCQRDELAVNEKRLEELERLIDEKESVFLE